jgi:hypothetical protein
LAVACVFGNAVNTFSTVLARIRSAIINVGLAVLSSVSFLALASVVVDLIMTLGSVLARCVVGLQSSATSSVRHWAGGWFWCRGDQFWQVISS